MSFWIDDTRDVRIGRVIGVSLTFTLLLVFVFMAGCPRYGVYSKQMSGRAQLAEAESNRQIAVLEAQAKHESAKQLAQAEIERAKGVAEANRIIGQSLHQNEAYLRWLWIEGLQHTQNQIIYIPTEGALPILEAGRRSGNVTLGEKPSVEKK